MASSILMFLHLCRQSPEALDSLQRDWANPVIKFIFGNPDLIPLSLSLSLCPFDSRNHRNHVVKIKYSRMSTS